MSDLGPGHINIGGKIKKSIVKDLCYVLRREDALFDFGGQGLEEDTLEELKKFEQGGILKFANEDAKDAVFEEVEAFCIEHDIPYDAWGSCAGAGFAKEFRPGVNDYEEYSWDVDSDGNWLVRRESLVSLMKSVENGDPSTGGRFAEVELREHVASWLGDVIGPENPELPEVEFTDD